MRPLFESDNIIFVEVSELLIDEYLIMINDYENVNRFIGSTRNVYTKQQEIKWVHDKLDEKAPVFSMIEKTSGCFIGNIELMDPTDSEGELGIAITAKKQNLGYGTEAILAMIDYGIHKMGLKRIRLRTRPFNSRAIHVYNKCGFREYDRTDDHIFMEVFR